MIKINCESGVDASLLWRRAFVDAVSKNEKEIFFARGTYHFYENGATLKHCFVSNNDESVKKIAFYLNGVKDLKICGDDARFIFHGRISPFVLEECFNVRIEGISIDFADRFAYETKVIESDGNSVLMQIDGKFCVENGKFRVFDDGLDNMTGKLQFAAFDPVCGDVLMNGSYHVINQNLPPANGNMLRVPMSLRHGHTDFLLRHQARHAPAVVIDRSKDTVLCNLNIYHAEGMGVIGQNSENILLDRVNVIPADGQHLAVTDDATHFSECYGHIELRNCVLHHTLDDAVNIHGMYRRMRKIGNDVLLEACHFQQFGLWDGRDGDVIELLKCDTLEPYAYVKVKHFMLGTRQLYCLELADSLPPEFEDRDVARIMRPADCRVVISNCDLANNRNRGILVTGTEKVLIENNRIHSPGYGIYLSGDANYWYESGPDKYVEICGNTFDNCCYAAENTCPICVDPIIPRKKEGFFYHGKLNVHHNIFKTAQQTPVLQAHSLAELDFADNILPGHIANAVDMQDGKSRVR